MEEIKLSKELEKLAVENFYEYIRTKAIRFLKVGCEEYQKKDAFHMPNCKVDKKTLALLQAGCLQVTKYRGLTIETAFRGLGIPSFYRLLELFHFNVVEQRTVKMTGDYIMDEMFMEHEVTGQKMRLFNKVERKKPKPKNKKL